MEFLFCVYELGFVSGHVSGWARGQIEPFKDPRNGNGMLPFTIRTVSDAQIAYLLQLTEALVCLSALYVVKSGSSSTGKKTLSTNWLLVYLLFNAVDIVYMQFGEWVARFNPAYTTLWVGDMYGRKTRIGQKELYDINRAVANGGQIQPN